MSLITPASLVGIPYKAHNLIWTGEFAQVHFTVHTAPCKKKEYQPKNTFLSLTTKKKGGLFGTGCKGKEIKARTKAKTLGSFSESQAMPCSSEDSLLLLRAQV